MGTPEGRWHRAGIFERPFESVRHRNAASGTSKLTLVLDTTLANWKVSLLIDNVAAGSHTYSSNPNIGSVFLGAGTAVDTADNFTLNAVPEPNATVLMLGGLGVIILFRRRKLMA